MKLDTTWIWHGHTMNMVGTWVLHIKSEVIGFDTTQNVIYFEVSLHHSQQETSETPGMI